jgi:transcriptional regulator with GAF, ATPase, and Fis domain
VSELEREVEWLRRANELASDLARESDARKLLPRVLDAAVELTGAERGYLVRVKGRKPGGGWSLRVEVARGYAGEALPATRRSISRTAVDRLLASRPEGFVTTSELDKDVIDASSVRARKVLSVACVPLRLRGEIWGVLYLDHRFDEQAFTEGDLPALRTFAARAALALETAELRSEAEAVRAPAGMRELRATRAAARESQSGLIDTPAVGLVRFGGLVGGSTLMTQLYEEIERASRSWAPVLVVGEPGTGRSLVAAEVHARRADEPLTRIDCAAAAELPADARCVFLDRVSSLSPRLQAALLGLLEAGGEEGAIRVISAAGDELRAAVEDGSFRRDLFYRLDVLRVTVPPLRLRTGDVPQLLRHFFVEEGAAPALTPRARRLLEAYAWPGNVRELRNEVQRLAGLGKAEVTAQDLSVEVREGRGVGAVSVDTSGRTLAEVERAMIEEALRACGGNKSQTARQLGIPRSSLYVLLERYGLS